MQKRFFDGITPQDVSGQHNALRNMIETLHGVQIPPKPTNPLHDQVVALVITPGDDLRHTLALLNDIVAADLLDHLLKNKGVVEEGPIPMSSRSRICPRVTLMLMR